MTLHRAIIALRRTLPWPATPLPNDAADLEFEFAEEALIAWRASQLVGTTGVAACAALAGAYCR
jgi:hypothetical protein